MEEIKQQWREESKCYDKEKEECKCPWNIETSTGSRNLFYSYCHCGQLTDIRAYKLKYKIYWTLRLWGIIKRPLTY